MASVDVPKFCIDSINQISEYIDDSVLYLDAGCVEAFQFLGAFPLLLELGVRSVCSLENMSVFDSLLTWPNFEYLNLLDMKIANDLVSSCSEDKHSCAFLHLHGLKVVDWSSNLDPVKKMVVITSRLLSDAHRYILRCLSTHQMILHCTIFTSISEIAHSAYPDSPLGPDAFHEYETLLLQDYEELLRKSEAKGYDSPKFGICQQSEDQNSQETPSLEDKGWSHLLSSEDVAHPEASSRERDLGEATPTHCVGGWQKLLVSVRHFPLILCPLSPRAFVLPSEGMVAEACLSVENEDSICPGLPPISSGMPSDSDDIPPGAIFTAHFLYHLAAKMDLKMEIFSFGDLSKSVGKILMDMSSLYDVGRRKRTVGLLLIDRTLDLVTPCCHGDSLIDRIFSCLPRRERTHCKGSQSQNKKGASLQRAPLDVQVPLGKVLLKEPPTEGFQLAEDFEAFLCGWDSIKYGSQAINLSNSTRKVKEDNAKYTDFGVLSGSFVSDENYRGTFYLEAILDRRTKDGALLINKWLQEALRREKVAVDIRARPGLAATELHSMVKVLAEKQSSLLGNRGIIQLALAASMALGDPHGSQWDAFISAERMLNVSAGDTSQSLSAQIGDLINKSMLVESHRLNKQNMEHSQGLLSFQDALLLAITGYILAGQNFPTSGSSGPFSWQEEHFLKEAIMDAILENPVVSKFKFLHGISEALETNFKVRSEKTKEKFIDDFDDDQWGSWGDEDSDQNGEQVYDDMQLKLELRDRVDNLFKFFHKLSNLKRSNIPLREGSLALENDFDGDPHTRKGLLHKILTMALAKYDIPGLEYHSSTVGRLFKSGFGRFGLGQAKPSLGDQNVILAFVVGGINGVEVREAQEALSESGRPDIELIVGGTTFITPNDMLDMLLGNSSYQF